MSKKKTNVMIVSDIHLGSRVSRAKELLEMLKSYHFKKLILLGDIFDDLDFKDLTEKQWKLLFHIRKLSSKTEVIWIEGNHDMGLSRIMSHLVGVDVKKTHIWKYKGERCLAIHGHQFDRFLVNNIIISWIATIAYLLIQRIDTKNYTISRFIKKKSKSWMRLSEKVANGAILYGKLRRAKYVFCGHTHKAMELTKYGSHYYNSGCWTDVPSSYITIDEKGIKINKYS